MFLPSLSVRVSIGESIPHRLVQADEIRTNFCRLVGISDVLLYCSEKGFDIKLVACLAIYMKRNKFTESEHCGKLHHSGRFCKLFIELREESLLCNSTYRNSEMAPLMHMWLEQDEIETDCAAKPHRFQSGPNRSEELCTGCFLSDGGIQDQPKHQH